MKNIENTTKRHISITMLTWDLIDEVEAITGQLVFEDDICREIEHDLYCACMNQHNSDPSQTEMEWFIYELTVTMKYGKTEAMKEVAKHLHEMLTKPTTEAQEITNEEEQTMNTNTKKYSFEIRQIDALNYGEDEGWIWNTSYNMGEMVTKAQDVKRAFTAWMKNHAGITFKPNRTLIEYDGDVYTIIDRKTKEPLFAAIPNC
jgi:hypothetical protein